MPLSVGEAIWLAALGAIFGGILFLIVWISIHAWAARKEKKYYKKTQKVLRELKEAEARADAHNDVFFKEVQAFYDGI